MDYVLGLSGFVFRGVVVMATPQVLRGGRYFSDTALTHTVRLCRFSSPSALHSTESWILDLLLRTEAWGLRRDVWGVRKTFELRTKQDSVCNKLEVVSWIH